MGELGIPAEYDYGVPLLIVFEITVSALCLPPTIRLLGYTCARMSMHTYRHAPNSTQDGLFGGHTSITNKIANIPFYTTWEMFFLIRISRGSQPWAQNSRTRDIQRLMTPQ